VEPGQQAHDNAAQNAGINADIQRTAGQRRVNILWEITQAIVAIIISGAKIYCTMKKIEDKTLDAGFMMILTAYYMRTNHTKIGGVGGTDSR
jgi:hypothetical protein